MTDRARVFQATPLRDAPDLGRLLGVGSLMLKMELLNPAGFQKDRAAEALVRVALSRNSPGITAGTCGNLGLSLVTWAGRSNLPVVLFVPGRYDAAKLSALGRGAVRVVRVPGGYEDAVAASGAFALESGLFDANPGGPGGTISLEAYQPVARELAQDLGRLPDSVWVPVGNGTTLAGIGRGFLELAGPGSPPPRICGAGSLGNTAAVRSILAGVVVELDPRSMRETPDSEPLLNWRSFHAAEALQVVASTGGLAYEATDQEMVNLATLLRDREGIRALPASGAALAGLRWAMREGRLAPGLHVVILTG